MNHPERLSARTRVALTALFLAAHAAVIAAPPVSTIVMVLPRDEENIEAAFRDYLGKRNLPVRIETVRFSGRAEDGPAMVAQVRKLAPSLVYSWGTTTTLAVAGTYDAARPQDFIRDIPVVFTEVTDPLGTKLLRQLNPPGRNVTGVSHVAPLAVQLNAIRSYRPFTRLGYITNPKEPSTVLVAQSLRKLSESMKFTIVEQTIPLDASGNPDPAALPALIRAIAEQKVDFLYIGPSTFLAFTHRDLVTQAALDARVPTFCATESIVRKAKCMFGLFSRGSNVGRFAAYKAAQVLADQTPVEKIPAESLQRFSLLINMPVVKSLQLYPPLTLLNVAEVIE
jgi:putative tryptophan/tyrosine transport system substrate-binding protein